jgi:hypothetical protein
MKILIIGVFMKHYMVLFLVFSWVVLGDILMNSPTLAQIDPATHEDPATSSANRPGSSTNPIIEPADPNEVIQKEKSGEVVPEKIKRPDDLCDNEINNSKMKGQPLPKKNCIKNNHSIKPKNR